METNLRSRIIKEINDSHVRNIHLLLAEPLITGEAAIDYIRDRAGDGDRIFLELIQSPSTGTYEIFVTIEDSSETHPDKHCSALQYIFEAEDTDQGLAKAVLMRDMIFEVLKHYNLNAENPRTEESDNSIIQMQTEGIKLLTSFSSPYLPQEIMYN